MKVKERIKLVLGAVTILLLLSGCSTSKPSLELISAAVEITDDEEKVGGVGITSGDREGEFIYAQTLIYDFVIKNTGKSTLGGAEKPNFQTFDYADGIKVSIEPKQELLEVSTESLGINIYDAEDNNLGREEVSTAVLEPNQEGKYSFKFKLGATEENPDLVLTPPAEQLDQLRALAMQAHVVVTVEDEEIARFDLSDWE
ncbi:hypothetical protein [Paenibacillus daejeonensis]|uniref:hypothetical protein n=1 Tax=Paenibacillus daejeonensis TaxID=135193 RepID=UPI0003645FB9|nr:hypothetical protein [Paenibacillus daejeonensis]